MRGPRPVPRAGPAAPGVKPVKRARPQSEADDRHEPLWDVIVWNDPVNLMTYVTLVLQRIFGFPRPLAEKLMMEVHQRGKAIVATETREKAELHVHQLHGYRLQATMSQH
jgi:ATP-dependent Clp protease adaptor protein ClpS